MIGLAAGRDRTVQVGADARPEAVHEPVVREQPLVGGERRGASIGPPASRATLSRMEATTQLLTSRGAMDGKFRSAHIGIVVR